MKKRPFVSLLFVAMALELSSGARAGANQLSDRCYGVRVRAADSESRTRVFSATAAKDLVIEIAVPDAAASHPVQVKLFTPRGRLYQVIDARADGAQSVGEGRRRQRGRSLVARFPVAGTQVTTHALFGEWRAEVYLDGAETACARPLRFVIER